MRAALITTNLRTKIRTIPGPAVRSLWRSKLFSLVKLHLSRVPPADEEPPGVVLAAEAGLLLEPQEGRRPGRGPGGRPFPASSGLLLETMPRTDRDRRDRPLPSGMREQADGSEVADPSCSADVGAATDRHRQAPKDELGGGVHDRPRLREIRRGPTRTGGQRQGPDRDLAGPGDHTYTSPHRWTCRARALRIAALARSALSAVEVWGGVGDVRCPGTDGAGVGSLRRAVKAGEPSRYRGEAGRWDHGRAPSFRTTVWSSRLRCQSLTPCWPAVPPEGTKSSS